MLRCLLRVKNGSGTLRKSGLRQITQKAKWFGAQPLLGTILEILMSNPNLDDQDRHIMIKCLNRAIYVLGDQSRPFIHKILVVAEQMLLPRKPDAMVRGEEYYEKAEAKEVIANLAKAVGLPSMIAAMRTDVESKEEDVRSSTAIVFAVVAQALGVSPMLDFLRVCCQSRSWPMRHTGMKIIAQIASLLNCGVLPHLGPLAEIVTPGLEDPEAKLRISSALAIAALADAVSPHGIDHFGFAVKHLADGITRLKGKPLGTFLKALGSVVPLMNPDDADRITKYLMTVVIGLFSTVEEEMKKVILRIVRQCITTKGVSKEYIVTEILPPFMREFWVRRVVASRSYRPLVELTVAMAQQVGPAKVLTSIVPHLLDDAEGFRRMVLETTGEIVTQLGTTDLDSQLEGDLFEGMIHTLREQTEDSDGVAQGVATVIKSMGVRCTLYLPRLKATLVERLRTTRNPRFRQQSAELLVGISPTLRMCDESGVTLIEMSKILYEMLRTEEDPNALGAVVQALDAVLCAAGLERVSKGQIIDVINQMKDVMANRHDKVQEACVNLIGNIAERNPDPVSQLDWQSLCIMMLDVLKAPKKAVRKAATKAFGSIAKAADPVHVINTLLENLKTTERTQRVCTTVALAVVAEKCQPYVVIPFLLNEYRTPDSNVQHGVLKALSFLFEYVGELSTSYAFKIVPLLEDALMERDMVHRQIACNVCKHLILALRSTGVDDAIVHLLNMVWPNIFETTPHCINSVLEVLEAVRVSLGPTILLQYLLTGLFHPARFVREVFWRVYNHLYIGAQHALVPSMPRLEDDEQNCYRRWELEIFI